MIPQQNIIFNFFKSKTFLRILCTYSSQKRFTLSSHLREKYLEVTLNLWTCLKNRSSSAIRKEIILKWSFCYFKNYFIFLMLINTWKFHLLNWQGERPVWVISGFFYAGLLVWASLSFIHLTTLEPWITEET